MNSGALLSNFSLLPFSFFVGLLVWFVAVCYGWAQRRKSFGLPLLAVLGTVFAWYFGDALYNDYFVYTQNISKSALDFAWFQVSLFIVSLTALARPVSDRFLGNLTESSRVYKFYDKAQFSTSAFQDRLDLMTRGMLALWCILMLIAIIRVQFDFVGLFAPYLGMKAEPWGRNRIGSGFDFLYSLAKYLQIFLTSGFLVVAALSTRRNTRLVAIFVCFLSLPYFIFDRTRNAMIATLLPGFLAWVFLRVKGGIVIKCSILVVAFFSLSVWFAFVLEVRSHKNIGAAFATTESVLDVANETKHLGLDMFGELGWINLFIERGSYVPNWGKRYFAELVNPIPRIIWPEKPMIGIDYAIARGYGGGSEASGGVVASISTGMIGQGVVNFGGWLGPIASAFLMSLWVGILARQDALSTNPARLMLYSIGLILTFNMGRDITLLVGYPFLFGWIIVRVIESRDRRGQSLPRLH